MGSKTHFGIKPRGGLLEVNTGYGNTEVSKTYKQNNEAERVNVTGTTENTKSLNGLPLKKGDPAIRPGDSGKEEAIKIIQEFLQTLPKEQERQKFLGDFGKGYSLLDENHYGKFDIETGKALQEYQLDNKERIKKVGQLSDSEFELEKDTIGYATYRIIREDKGERIDSQETSGEEIEKDVSKQNENLQGAKKNKLADPIKAKEVPEAQYYVKTINPKHRLALRLAPSYVQVSKEAYEDIDKKGDLVIMMPNETLLKVISGGVGFQCLWSQVEIVDKDPIFDVIRDRQKTEKFYAFSEFLHPLNKTIPFLPVRCPECKDETDIKGRKTLFPAWQTLDECDPFYDAETCSYYITVNSDFLSTSEERIRIQEAEMLEKGVKFLLEFYDKQREPDDIKRYIKSPGFAHVSEYYLDKRPGSKLKFLIKAPAKYFDSIPNNTDYLKDIAIEGEKLPEHWKTISFQLENLQEQLDKVVSILADYDKELNNWNGEIVDYDFFNESERLRNFIPIFEWFVEKNGLHLNSRANIKYEIGFYGKCFKVAYVLASKDEITSFPLRIGFNCFVKKEPIKYERTMGYLFYSEAIVKDTKNDKIPWAEFLLKFTCPPPEIRPSKISQRKIREIKYEKKLVKTTAEKSLEDKKLKDPKLKKEVYQDIKNLQHFVGDSMLSCDTIPYLLDGIYTIEDLFELVLNNVNISSLASFMTSCIAYRMSPQELYMTMCRSVFNSLGINELQKCLEFFDNTILVNIHETTIRMQKTRQINDDAELLRAAILVAASNDEICRAIYQMDPFLIISRIKSLFEFEKRRLSPPTLEIDEFNIEDIMASIGDSIVDIMRQILASALIGLVKMIFRSFCELCESPFESQYRAEPYGSVSVSNFIPPGSRKVFDDFVNPEDNMLDVLKKFLDDISSLLLPSEICSLLRGTPSNELVNFIYTFISERYPVLLKYFYNTSVIKSFFKNIGNNANLDFCDALEKSGFEQQLYEEDNLCFDLENDIRRQMLEGKMSPSQIDKQLENIKNRDKESLQKLSDLLNDDILRDLIPQVPKGKNCKKGTKNVFTETPPPVQFLNDSIINSIFGNVYSMFNSDMGNFINSILYNGRNRVKEFDLEFAKKSLNAQRMRTEGEGDEEEVKRTMDNLKQDPLAIGEKRSVDSKIVVAEDVKNVLYAYSNRRRVFEIDREFVEPVYDFSGEIQLSNDIANALKRTYEKLGLNKNDKLNVNKECEEEIFKLKTDTLVRYYIPSFSSIKKELKDVNNIIINDDRMNKLIIIEDKKEMEEAVRVNVESYMRNGVNPDISLQQEVFVNYISSLWSEVVNNESQKIVSDKKSVFCNFFRDVVYHDINVNLMNSVSLIVGNSKLFNAQEFSKIKFVENVFSNYFGSNVCPPNYDNNMLNIFAIKDKVKENNEKLSTECESLTATSLNQQFTSIEKANQDGVIETFIRLYVVEYLLRGMFVFSEFKIDELVKNDIIAKYFVEKIKQELKNEGNEFYNNFMLKTKEMILNRGMKLIDPYKRNDPDAKEDAILKNELHPKNRTGEAFLEFSIKEQILNLTNKFSDMFGVDVGKVDNKIFSVSEIEKDNEKTGIASDDIYDIFDDDMSHKFTTLTYEYDNNRKTAVSKRVPKKRYLKGRIEFERYVRVTSEFGETINKIEDIREFGIMNGNIEFLPEMEKCGFLGLRMIYVLPLNEQTKRAMDGIHLKPEMYSRMFNTTNVTSKSFITDEGNVVSIPLLFVESEEAISYKDIAKIDIDGEIKKLKQKMLETSLYKFLFHYVFSLPRILTSVSIYNILLMSKKIDNIDSCFMRTKRLLRALIRATQPNKDWWKTTDEEIEKMGGNEGLYQQRMDNIKTTGTDPSLFGMAMMTIPIIIKGMAEMQDPCYKLMKQLFDFGIIDSLSWSEVYKVMPCNVFPFVGFGPPLMTYGAVALTLPLLSGEQREKEIRNHENDSIKEIEKDCKKGENK